MQKRLLYLFRYWITLMAIFIVEKPLFMLYASGQKGTLSLRDYVDVMYHALPVDLSCAAYFLIIPLLLIIVSIWWNNLPLRNIMRFYNIALAIALALAFVSDAALYPFWGFKLDSSVFFYLKSPQEAMASVSVWFVLVAVLLISLLVWIITKLLNNTYCKPNKVKRVFPVTLLFVLLMAPLFLSMRGGLKESTMNIGKVYYSTNQFLNHSAVNPVFSVLSSISKSDDYSQQYNYFDEQERELLFNGLYSTTGSDTPILLNTERPNVLIILMEGFGGDFLSSISGLQDVAPNLDSLAAQGVFFSNCYAGSFRTDRGIVCALNGHPGLPSESIMKMPNKSRNLPSLAKKFVEMGYSTDFFYGGDINFTNMQSYLWSNGYQSITADTDFSVAERQTNAWGVNDDITFSALLEKLKNREDSLWHTTFLTLSSHEPFKVPSNRFEDDICNSFAYTDSCIGAFVDSLKQTALWENTLLVLMPDHGFCYPRTGFKSAPHAHHIPVIWTGGAVKQPVKIDKLMNQTDMAATLLAQMKIDFSDFLFSRNVLSEQYNDQFAFYTFVDGFCYIDSTGATLYDNAAGKVQENMGNGTAEQNLNRENRGKAILQTLYDDLDAR
ncbi:MAG: LTA synthase family protein [Bacteroidaceae bacterium]|nr:LTA synthase family protein [Bacteroidaceae bacterium]